MHAHAMRRIIFSLAVAVSSCSNPAPEELAFVRKDAPSTSGDPSGLFLADALSRLTPEEQRRYGHSSDVAGFLFQGAEFTCIVVVILNKDVVTHAPNPAFCYDKTTNKFVKRL